MCKLLGGSVLELGVIKIARVCMYIITASCVADQLLCFYFVFTVFTTVGFGTEGGRGAADA